MFINIDVEVEEAEKLLNLIVALKTKMEEHCAPPIPVVKETREPVNEKMHLCETCETCKYEKIRSITESPCITCGIEEGRHDHWEVKDGTD